MNLTNQRHRFPTMNKDWQNALQALLNDGNLPEGATSEPEKEPEALAQTGKLIISFERKGRAGKTATIVSGFTVDNSEVERIASVLKTKLGTGGSARGGEILIQGDRREDVCRLLQQLGYKV